MATLICSKCRDFVDNSDAFCGSCGRRFVQANPDKNEAIKKRFVPVSFAGLVKHCSRCGEFVSNHKRYCSRCGSAA